MTYTNVCLSPPDYDDRLDLVDVVETRELPLCNTYSTSRHWKRRLILYTLINPPLSGD